jgi:hypothetical protein
VNLRAEPEAVNSQNVCNPENPVEVFPLVVENVYAEMGDWRGVLEVGAIC